MDWLKRSLLDAPIIEKDGYHYFVHPISDGVPMLEPGLLREIVIKIIKDKDDNDKWSQWSLNPYKQPEKVLWFNTPIKVRANWEVEMKLELNNEK